MTDHDYIAELKKRWPRKGDATFETIALADQATHAFPGSPQLWCMRGSLIQLGPGNCPHSLDDALASYKRALEIDPKLAEAWEESASYDNVLNDETNAQQYFREAEKLRGHP